MNKTKDYDIFNFREDNRSKIDLGHVDKLSRSIELRNLLELRPIIVNEKMEIIDGQHRLLAAKNLGVAVCYKIQEDISSNEIILMNISKQWRGADYMNFYCKNMYPEYLKLKDFMDKNNLSLHVALSFCNGNSSYSNNKFKEGLFKFNDDISTEKIDVCWETIRYIKRMNGHSRYTESTRFWKSLLKLVNHTEFKECQWKKNYQMMIERFCCKASHYDYCKMLSDVYNYRSAQKIELIN